MSRPRLPSAAEVLQARNRVIAEARDGGTRPSVLALAHQLGLANTTFRRHFPDIARELGQIRRTPTPEHTSSAARNPCTKLQERNAKLGRDNAALTEHLELAIANIQRLTLETHQLREQLEAATKITRIKPQRSPSRDPAQRP